jgi:hypothetical protein
MILKIPKFLFTLSLIILLLLTSCSSQPPSRFERAQQESLQAGSRNQAVTIEALGGATFNQFFPPSGDGYERVYTQEKRGFVQAKLKQDGQEVAVLSVFDTISNPSAAEEFAHSQQTIDGYPLVEKGQNTTAILVGDRFQVKITSRDSAFTPELRRGWLAKFDLAGLAKLKQRKEK